MSPPIAIAQDLHASPAPFLGELTRRLLASLRRDAGTERSALVEKMLAFASDAERTIAAQQDRIAQLETLSLTDELTGLCNRRGFEAALERELAAASRYGEAGAVLYLDLDGFKAINDAHGHHAGDAALRHVARLLAANTRASDLAARLHGDEFAVLLVRTDLAGAQMRARTLHGLLRATPMRLHGRRIAVGASLGLAGFAAGTRAGELLRRADRDMYRAKRARPRVVAG